MTSVVATAETPTSATAPTGEATATARRYFRRVFSASPTRSLVNSIAKVTGVVAEAATPATAPTSAVAATITGSLKRVFSASSTQTSVNLIAKVEGVVAAEATPTSATATSGASSATVVRSASRFFRAVTALIGFQVAG